VIKGYGQSTGRFGRTFCKLGCEMFHDAFERRFKNESTHWIRYCPIEGRWSYVRHGDVQVLHRVDMPQQVVFKFL